MTNDERELFRTGSAAHPNYLPVQAEPLRMAAHSRSLLLSAAVMLLQACAVQSPPQPPRLERPAAVNDLAAEQIGPAIKLRFTLPKEAVDGEDIRKPLEIELARTKGSAKAVKTSGASAPASFAATWMPVKRPALTGPDASGKLEYTLPFTPEEFKKSVGETLRFELRTLTRGFRGRAIESDPSNVVSLTLLDAAEPVTGLGVEATQDALELRWSAPAETLTGSPAPAISTYQVYRSEGVSGAGKPGPYHMIGQAHETSYSDENFEFGTAYAYEVRAVVSANGASAASQDSRAVEIVPRDTFPPAVPSGVTGLYTSGAVELLWDPNLERDLAGYSIRRGEESDKLEPLNRQLLPSPLYRDTTVQPGHHYYYQVTAVDTSGNESGPSAEIEVAVP